MVIKLGLIINRPFSSFLGQTSGQTPDRAPNYKIKVNNDRVGEMRAKKTGNWTSDAEKQREKQRLKRLLDGQPRKDRNIVTSSHPSRKQSASPKIVHSSDAELSSYILDASKLKLVFDVEYRPPD